ncbi:MAG: hypothetical protein KC503_17235 [Myxococcales bacterium]|nr:hypothetical protein [Myxococcales bacterium]
MKLELDDAHDQRVLNALRTGDSQRAALLMVNTYGKGVVKLCAAVARTPEEAEELTYSSFARAFSAFGDFRASGSPAAWMLEIARTRCRELLAELAEAEPVPRAPVFGYIDGDVPPGKLADWLSEQSPLGRAALGLYVHGGASVEEIAADAGSDVETCSNWMMALLSDAASLVRGEATPAGTPPRGSNPTAIYPKVIAALTALDVPLSESLRRRLDVLVAAL